VNLTKTYFMVPVVDMDRAVAFYRDTVGLAVRFVSPEWTELAWRDATIALHRGGATDRQGWLGFEVDDLDAALAELAAAGATIGETRNEAGTRLVAVTDPEGNVVTFGQQPSWG